MSALLLETVACVIKVDGDAVPDMGAIVLSMLQHNNYEGGLGTPFPVDTLTGSNHVE